MPGPKGNPGHVRAQAVLRHLKKTKKNNFLKKGILAKNERRRGEIEVFQIRRVFFIFENIAKGLGSGSPRVKMAHDTNLSRPKSPGVPTCVYYSFSLKFFPPSFLGLLNSPPLSFSPLPLASSSPL